MDRQIRKALGEEILKEIEAISKMETGSSEKSKAISDLSQLYKMRIDERKVEYEYGENYDVNSREEKKLQLEDRRMQIQIKEQNTDRCIRFGIDVLNCLLPLACYGVWYYSGLEFERTNNISSPMLKNLMGLFKPKRK